MKPTELGKWKFHVIARQSLGEFETEVEKYLASGWNRTQEVSFQNECWITCVEKYIIIKPM